MDAPAERSAMGPGTGTERPFQDVWPLFPVGVPRQPVLSHLQVRVLLGAGRGWPGGCLLHLSVETDGNELVGPPQGELLSLHVEPVERVRRGPKRAEVDDLVVVARVARPKDDMVQHWWTGIEDLEPSHPLAVGGKNWLAVIPRMAGWWFERQERSLAFRFRAWNQPPRRFALLVLSHDSAPSGTDGSDVDREIDTDPG